MRTKVDELIQAARGVRAVYLSEKGASHEMTKAMIDLAFAIKAAEVENGRGPEDPVEAARRAAKYAIEKKLTWDKVFYQCSQPTVPRASFLYWHCGSCGQRVGVEENKVTGEIIAVFNIDGTVHENCKRLLPAKPEPSPTEPEDTMHGKLNP